MQVWATDAAPGEFLQFQPSKAMSGWVLNLNSETTSYYIVPQESTVESKVPELLLTRGIEKREVVSDG